MNISSSKLFGSRARTRILQVLSLVEESWPSEIARLAKLPVFSVQRIVDSLEKEGLVATRKLGVERRVTFNPRFYALKSLRQLLLETAEQEADLVSAVSHRRSRPRHRKKPL